MMKHVGLIDTTFARVNMGAIAEDTLKTLEGYRSQFDVLRYTVPGFKDLAVASKRLIELNGADIVLAMGWSGGEALDNQSAQIASWGLMQAQLSTSTHILEVFVHVNESPDDPLRLAAIATNRVQEHAKNAHTLLFAPKALSNFAGRGIRQGEQNIGPLIGSSS